ncbi:MAG: hypothetical protein K2N05_02820 [Muribaculaceae bacterium]|nr:hypothetical protein [Muribaculaceae bacterium]
MATESTEADSLLSRAKELVDSATYPYDYARLILAQRLFDKPGITKRYMELKHNLDYFTQIGDKRMMLFSYRRLGSLYLHIGDYEAYYDCSKKQEELAIEMGLDSMAVKNRINFVLYHTQKGDTIKARKIIEDILKNKYVLADSDYMGRVYVNLANLTRSPEYFKKALEISPTFSSSLGIRHSLEFAMMEKYEEQGKYEVSDSLAALIGSLVLSDGDALAKSKMHAIYSRQAVDRNDYERAYAEKTKEEMWKDSSNTDSKRLKVSQLSYQEELRRQEREMKHIQSMTSLRWLTGVAFFLLITVIIFVYFRHRHTRLKMRQLATEVENANLSLALEKEKRSLVAMRMAMDERDNLINDVMKVTDTLQAEGKVSSEVKNVIATKVKISQMSQKEWEDFQLAYSRVHPDFVKSFKEKYPGVSEGDVRLALYLSAGLSTKQIAQAMRVQAESIKKNRQRLRKRMGIKASESLEDILRSFL